MVYRNKKKTTTPPPQPSAKQINLFTMHSVWRCTTQAQTIQAWTFSDQPTTIHLWNFHTARRALYPPSCKTPSIRQYSVQSNCISWILLISKPGIFWLLSYNSLMGCWYRCVFVVLMLCLLLFLQLKNICSLNSVEHQEVSLRRNEPTKEKKRKQNQQQGKRVHWTIFAPFCQRIPFVL